MSIPSEIGLDPKAKRARLRVVSVATILLAILAAAAIAAVVWYRGITSLPSVTRQSEDVVALETHVLPLVKDLRATWFHDGLFGSDSMHWSRGKFNRDEARALQDGDQLFDKETEASFEQFAQAIQTSGVPTDRLSEAEFAADGSLRTATFRRRGGGMEFVLNYIYSPGAKPEEWTSPLGPVVLKRIGDSDWWFEVSPND